MDLSTGIRRQHSEGGLLSKYVGEHPPKYNHLTPLRALATVPLPKARQAGQGRRGQLPTGEDQKGGLIYLLVSKPLLLCQRPSIFLSWRVWGYLAY